MGDTGNATLEWRWQIQTVKQVHQCLLSRAPSYLVGKFVRDCHMLHVERANYTYVHQPHTEFY